jgi:hypothetical protein
LPWELRLRDQFDEYRLATEADRLRRREAALGRFVDLLLVLADVRARREKRA